MSDISGIDLTGKVVRLKQSFFKAGIDAKDCLFKCEGGFGCSPCSLGTKIFGKFLSDGEQAFVRREHIEAVVAEEDVKG